MQAHKGVKDVGPCSALANLAFNEDNQQKVAKTAGIEAVVEVTQGMMGRRRCRRRRAGYCATLQH